MNRKTPTIVLFITLGIIIGSTFLKEKLYILLISLNILILVMIIKILSKNKKYFFLFCFYLLGISLVFIREPVYEYEDIIDDKLILNGLVDSIETNDNYIIKSDTMIKGGKEYKFEEKIYMKIYGESEFKIGDSISIKTNLNYPRENTNPNMYNHKRHLKSKGINLTCNIKDRDIIRIDQVNKPMKYRLKNNFREFVNIKLNKYIDLDNADLMSGIILGDYSYIDDESLENYRELGLAHLLAVSGLHIGIISGFFIYLFSVMSIQREISYPIIMLILWLYGYLIGFPISILRANIMLSISMISELIHEPEDRINTVFVSMFVLLLINPFSIYNLSFQLSYIAVLSLIIITPKIKSYIYPKSNRIIDNIASIISVQIGLMPIQMYYFNYISIIGIISNLIIVPIMSFALILSLFIIMMETIFPLINIFIGYILNYILNINALLLNIISKYDFININVFSPKLIEIIGYYILIIIILEVDNIKKIKIELINYLVIISISCIFIILLDFGINNKIEVHYIDVGQGDSVLIKSKYSNYLIDSGGEVFGDFSVGKNITMPYLIKNNVRSLEAVFISHFHDDHSKGFIDILDNLPVDNVFISYRNEENNTYKKIQDKELNVKILKKDDILKLGEGLWIKILSPNPEDIEERISENDLSLVMNMYANNTKLLFTGDMEKRIEKRLIKDGSLGECDILKVPHHGSKTSSTEEFIDQINPENVIFMVGKNNNFGHPNEEVLERYKNRDSNIYRTDEKGRILVEINRNNFVIESYMDIDMFNIKYIYVYLISLFIGYLMIKYDLKEELI